jgi:hypothetical protein
MDLEKVLRDLYSEKQELERVIAELEELNRAAHRFPVVSSKPERRGRKQMGELERKEVSERMKAYWRNRRTPELNPSTHNS